MLEIKDISKSFKDKEVLKNVSWNLESGKVYGFLGNNGAGKTTLQRIIFNMAEPNSGTVTFDGLSQDEIDYSKWFYFTETDVVPTGMKIKNYLREVALLAKISDKEFKNRMSKVKGYVKTNFSLNKKIKKLSSGQQKIVGCLALLILKPDVVFLDEPTANMDIRNQKFVLDILKELKNDKRIVVITTHLLKEIGEVLTDVAILDKGEIKYKGSVSPTTDLEEIFTKYTTPDENTIVKDEKKELNNEVDKESIGEYLND